MVLHKKIALLSSYGIHYLACTVEKTSSSNLYINKSLNLSARN